MRLARFGLNGFSFVILIGLAALSQASDSYPAEWTANPASITQSSTDIILTAPSSQCISGFDSRLDGATVHVQEGLGITGSPVQHSGYCELTITLKGEPAVSHGTLRLTVLPSSTPGADPKATIQPLGVTDILLAPAPPGAIPPGLEPQVDAMWEVEDYDVVRQNFGKDIADHFVAVLVKLGNNTGYNLILDGIAFELGSQTDTSSSCISSPNCSIQNPVPSETPMLLLGVVAYGENYSARNIGLRALQWASLLTTGLIPFVSGTAYAGAVAIFNGPFQKGYAAQFPDLTVQQLQRLGGSTIIADSNELDNNASASFLAFLSRKRICSGPDNISIEGYAHLTLKEACGNGSAKHIKPAPLTKYLRQVVLAGVRIPAANARFRVVAGSQTPGPGFVLTSSAFTFAQNAQSGNQFTVFVTPSNGFTGKVDLQCTFKPDSGGSNSTCSLASSVYIPGISAVQVSGSVPSQTTPGEYTITVTGTSGSLTADTSIPFTVSPPK